MCCNSSITSCHTTNTPCFSQCSCIFFTEKAKANRQELARPPQSKRINRPLPACHLAGLLPLSHRQCPSPVRVHPVWSPRGPSFHSQTTCKYSFSVVVHLPTKTCGLAEWFSKCGRWAIHISVTWDLLETRTCGSHPRCAEAETLGMRPSSLSFNSPLAGSDTHSSSRPTELWWVLLSFHSHRAIVKSKGKVARSPGP